MKKGGRRREGESVAEKKGFEGVDGREMVTEMGEYWEAERGEGEKVKTARFLGMRRWWRPCAKRRKPSRNEEMKANERPEKRSKALVYSPPPWPLASTPRYW